MMHPSSIQPNAHIAAMAPYALADLNVATGKRPIMLAQNESALPPSPLVVAAVDDVMHAAQFYPDPDWTGLRGAIAQVHDIAPEQILCGGGSMELIDCLTRCYAGPGDRVLSSQYGYAFFRTATRAVGAAFDAAPENDLTVSVDALLGAVQADTRMIFVANPGNPTGTRIRRSELVRLRDALADHIMLVIDEAYGEFADTPGEATFDLASRGNTVVLRTFSKAYGLAGMRVGWGVFPPAVATEMRKILTPNNISVAGQAAATAAMLDQAYMRATCAGIIDRRDRCIRELRNLGLVVPDSFTNFVLIRFPDGDAAVRADRALRAEGIVVRGMAGYGLPECLRVTVGSAADMACATEHLTKHLTTGHNRENPQ